MKRLILCALALTGASANALTFDDAVRICGGFYKNMTEAKDDGDSTIKTPGRLNVSFKTSNLAMVCSVGVESGEIEEAGTPGRMFSKERLKQAVAARKAREESFARIVAGDYSAFVKQAKEAITSRFKDPESARFRGLYLSQKELPTLCGEVNAKNSYGGYVGYRGFFYNTVSAYIDDGKELSEGYMYRSLQPKNCGEKFADVTEP